jgi:hypothetical protein
LAILWKSFGENSPAIHGWETAGLLSKSHQGRKKFTGLRTFLSSLTGLAALTDREPSHEWLGYFLRACLLDLSETDGANGV